MSSRKFRRDRSIKRIIEDFLPEKDEPVDEEYLDRLGVESNDSGISIPDRSREDESPVTYGNIGGSARELHRARMSQHQFNDEYTNDISTSSIRQDFFDGDRYIAWSNGDREVKPRRNRYKTRNGYPERVKALRNVTDRTVHSALDRKQHHFLGELARECEELANEYIYDTGWPLTQKVVDTILAMVDHYLEDVGDFVTMRYWVDKYQSVGSFSPSIRLRMELPGGLTHTHEIPLDRY